MRFGRALGAGCIGGVIALLIGGVAARVWNPQAGLAVLFGDMIVDERTSVVWVVGCAVQLGILIVAALLYAAIFEWVTHRAGAMLGCAIAVPHVIVAGLAVGFLPVARSTAVGFGPPGAFLEYRGGGIVIAFIVAHLVFGAVVGALYGPTRHSVPAARRAWRDVTAGGA